MDISDESEGLDFDPGYIEGLEEEFPNMLSEGYRPTSQPSDKPNCIGWALYDYNQYWDPSMIGVRGYYWPPGAPRNDSLESWTKVFEIHGYQICENAQLESDSEKIATYVTADGVPQHVARQRRSGKWISKLGKGADIEHDTLSALSGELYGTPVRFMKRSRHPDAE
ncbi:MAG: hypothetical protein DMG27_06925 [Acidobacteria bacterium]|nr:MAG: hypothetical protein DMG27_06925 [Acidobacteriota bacterium]